MLLSVAKTRFGCDAHHGAHARSRQIRTTLAPPLLACFAHLPILALPGLNVMHQRMGGCEGVKVCMFDVRVLVARGTKVSEYFHPCMIAYSADRRGMFVEGRAKVRDAAQWFDFVGTV